MWCVLSIISDSNENTQMIAILPLVGEGSMNNKLVLEFLRAYLRLMGTTEQNILNFETVP